MAARQKGSRRACLLLLRAGSAALRMLQLLLQPVDLALHGCKMLSVVVQGVGCALPGAQECLPWTHLTHKLSLSQNIARSSPAATMVAWLL